MNDYLLYMSQIAKRSVAYVKAGSIGDDNALEHYKKLKKQTKRLLTKHRRLFIMNKLGNLNINPKKFWRDMGGNLNIGKYALRGR